MQAEITDAEIKQLLFFMKDDKSPNLGGFTALFLKQA